MKLNDQEKDEAVTVLVDSLTASCEMLRARGDEVTAGNIGRAVDLLLELHKTNMVNTAVVTVQKRVIALISEDRDGAYNKGYAAALCVRQA